MISNSTVWVLATTQQNTELKAMNQDQGSAVYCTVQSAAFVEQDYYSSYRMYQMYSI